MKNTIAALLLATSLVGCATIDTGNRGIKTRMGEVINESIDEGLVTYNPLIGESVIEFDTKTKKLTDKPTTYTRDVQRVDIEYALNYNLKRTAVGKTYKEVGTDYEGVLLAPVLVGVIKDTVGKWDAVDLNSEREKAAGEILVRLKPLLDAKGITVTDFQIIDLKFDKLFEEAVERKVTAIQRAEEAKNKTVQVSEEARQKVIQATADAEAMRIKSNALAANPGLAAYEAVMQWDGHLPTTMVPGGALPFINMALK